MRAARAGDQALLRVKTRLACGATSSCLVHGDGFEAQVVRVVTAVVVAAVGDGERFVRISRISKESPPVGMLPPHDTDISLFGEGAVLGSVILT